MKTRDPHELEGPAVIIERAVPEDAEAILTIKRLAWLKAYIDKEHGVTQEDIERMFPIEELREGIPNWQKAIASENDQGENMTFVARINGRLVGYVSPTYEDGQKRIGALYVAPEMQGQGIGGKLVKQAIDWHGRDDDIYLHVVSYNKDAIEFYKRHGFLETGKEIPAEFDDQHHVTALPEIEMVLPS